MLRTRTTFVSILLLASSLTLAQTPSPAPQAPAAQAQLARAIFQELVEINTVTAVGNTLEAAQAMAARLKAAGFAEADVQVLSPAPRKGNLVARLRGTGAKKPMMLLAHIDVVPASASDWSSEPFKMVERDGLLFGRGVIDNKAMAAALVSNLIRYKQEGLRPARDLILVLETDEEILDANEMGIRWLLKNHRTLIDAEFALNEGAGVRIDQGKPVSIGVQTSEKVSVSFRLEVKNRGGHSSLPVKDNAITRLADGLGRLGRHDFPVVLNETTRASFERNGAQVGGAEGQDMRALAAGTADAATITRLSTRAAYNAQMRTTCVATTLEGGQAINALPQVARAGVNCRVLPGESVDQVQETLVRVLADEQISVTRTSGVVLSPPSPLNPHLMRAVELLGAQFWPGAAVIPVMSAGATDGSYLRNAGIPTYGHSGVAAGPDSGFHGRDERISVKAFHDAHEYLYRLIKLLASE